MEPSRGSKYLRGRPLGRFDGGWVFLLLDSLPERRRHWVMESQPPSQTMSGCPPNKGQSVMFHLTQPMTT